MLKNYHFKTLLVVCLMTIFGGMSAWAQTTVTQNSFSALEGNVDNDTNVSYTTAKGGAATAPAINSNVIRLYQISSGNTYGGTITISVADGYELSEVVIGSSMATKIAYTLDDAAATEISASEDLAANGQYTKSGLANQSITFYCMGTDKNSRLYVNYLSVTYKSKVASGKEPAGITFGETSTYVTTLAKGFTAPTLTNPYSLAISYTSSNEAVATVGTDGTITLQGNGETTITAHTEGDATHDPGNAKYTIKVLAAINGLEGLYADGVITTTEQEYLLTLTDAVVTYNNGKNTYIQDSNRGMMIFSTTDKPAVGTKISGDVIVKAKVYNNLYELTAFDASAATLTEASPAELQPAVATIADILASPKSYESKYIKIVDATVKSAFSSKNSVIYQGEETNAITMRDGNSAATLESKVGDIITVTGFPAVYNSTQQFTVWSQEDIVSAIKYFEYSAESFEAKIGVANTFPELTNDYDETPTYSSSNPAVATINDAGEVTLVAAGTTTITATLASAGKSASYELTVSELQSYAYTRVNDASEIVDGGKYILVAEPITVDDVETVLALTAPTGTNKYFASLAVPSDVYYYGPSDVAGKPYELTLESTGTDGRFFVKCNDVYLEGSSSSANFTFLDAKPETTNTNAIWAVEINDAKCDLTCVEVNKVLGVNKSTTDKRFALYVPTFTNLAVTHLYRRYNKTGEGSVTIATTEGYGTLYSDKAVVFPEGLTATTVKAAADGQLTMDWEYAAGNTVPAGTGLLIQGENGTTYDFITTDNAVTLSTPNLLSGSTNAATTEGADGSKFYKLTYSEVAGEQVLGFFWGAENGAAFTNEAGKAYLVIPAGSEANGFRLDGSAITGINNVALDRAADKIYTISGVAVSAQQGKLPAGLYIVNGQKQIVK